MTKPTDFCAPGNTKVMTESGWAEVYDLSSKKPIEEPSFFETTMAISTTHLPFEDTRLLNETDPSIMLATYPYGWVVPVDVDLEGTFFSPAFKKVLAFAKNNGCTWVRFDFDAHVMPSLPVFQWESSNVHVGVLKEIYQAAVQAEKGKPHADIKKIVAKAFGALGYTTEEEIGLCLSCGRISCDETKQ